MEKSTNVKTTIIALSWKIRIVTIACSIRHIRSEQPVGKQGAALLVVKGSASEQQKRPKKDAEFKVGMHLFPGAPHLMPGMRLISFTGASKLGQNVDLHRNACHLRRPSHDAFVLLVRLVCAFAFLASHTS